MRVIRRLQTGIAGRLGLGSDWTLTAIGACIGVVTALGAVAFAEALHWTEDQTRARQAAWAVWLLPTLPMLGALLTGLLVHFFASDARGHGVPQVIDALARKGGRIPARVGLIKVLASICTVGTGGSGGAEGPIVQIGSTTGSVLGRAANATREHMGTLVGCGAAAGIASVFNAPIAGVFFVLEILLRDFSLRTFTPIVVASVFSVATTQVVLGSNEAIFAVGLSGYAFSALEMPAYIGLGLLCAAVGVMFTRMLHKGEDIFTKVPLHPIVKPVSGALMLGLLGIGFVLMTRGSGLFEGAPAFFGNGYDTILRLIEPASYEAGKGGLFDPTMGFGLGIVLVLLGVLLVFKALGTVFTLASGGSGGVFAPSLFIGATAGAAYGFVLESIGLLPASGSPAAYALVGMAAVVASTTFAPLTAILLLFELTREPLVLVPAMLAATIASLSARLWMRDSIYTMRLRQAGVLLGSGRDLTVMRRVTAGSCEVTPLPSEPVYASDPLSKLVTLHAHHHVPDFVVVDQHDAYLGLVTGADMRTALIDREAIPLLLVAELLRSDLPAVHPDETLDVVMDKFAQYDVASLCMVDRTEPTRPAGLLTRASVIRRYQRALEDSH